MGLGEKAPEGAGGSDAGAQLGLDHLDDGHLAGSGSRVLGESCLHRDLSGVVHQDQGRDGLATLGSPEVHWGGWN